MNHIITKRVSHLMSDGSCSESDTGTDYQQLIETIGKRALVFDPENFENESSTTDQLQREDSIDKTEGKEQSDIKYDRLVEEPEKDDLSKPEDESETFTKIPTTPTSEQEVLVRGHASVSSMATSDRSSYRSDYNPIPKPSRKLPVNNN